MLWLHNATLFYLFFLLPMLLTFIKEKKVLKEDISFSPESSNVYSSFWNSLWQQRTYRFSQHRILFCILTGWIRIFCSFLPLKTATTCFGSKMKHCQGFVCAISANHTKFLSFYFASVGIGLRPQLEGLHCTMMSGVSGRVAGAVNQASLGQTPFMCHFPESCSHNFDLLTASSCRCSK